MIAITHHKELLRKTLIVATVAALLIGLAVFLSTRSFSAQATATPEQFFTFDIGTGTITDYDAINGPKDVVVPDTIGGVTVRAIAPHKAVSDGDGPATPSFRGKGLTSVVVGDTITDIGYAAFGENPLTSVTLGTVAYSGAATMTVQGGNFNPMEGQTRSILATVVINSVVQSIDGSFNDSSITSLSFPTGMTTISSSFANSLITDLTIQSSAVDIMQSFNDSSELRTLSVTTTGDIKSAFNNLPKITSINIPNVDEIAWGAFTGVSGSKMGDYPGSLAITIGTARVITDGAFSSLPHLSSLTITDVGSIGSGAFSGSSSWAKSDVAAYLDVTIDTAGDITYSFSYWPNLRNIHLGDVGEINSFSGTTAADAADRTEVTIDSAVKINSSAFQRLANLALVDIGQVGDIDSAFSGAGVAVSSLKVNSLEVIIGTVGDIGYNSFTGFSALSRVDIGQAGEIRSSFTVPWGTTWKHSDTASSLSVTIDAAEAITSGSFDGLPQLSSVVIGAISGNIESSFRLNGITIADTAARLEISIDSVNTISSSAFNSLPHLAKLTIESATAIESSFNNDYSWTITSVTPSLEVNIGTVGRISSGAFIEAPNLTSVEIDTVSQYIQGAFSGSFGWTIDDTADSLSVSVGSAGSIAYGAFGYLPHLTSVAIGTVQQDIASAFSGVSGWTIADTAARLNVSIDSVRSISNSFGYQPHLSSVEVTTVQQDITSSAFEGDDGWIITDTAPTLVVSIGSVQSIDQRSFSNLPHLSRVTITTISQGIDYAFYMDGGWTIADTTDSLEISIGSVGYILDDSFENLPHLSKVTINQVDEIQLAFLNTEEWSLLDTSQNLEVSIGSFNTIHTAAFSGLPQLKTLEFGKKGVAVTPTGILNDYVDSGAWLQLPAFAGSNAIETLSLYSIVSEVSGPIFTDKHIKTINIGADIELSEESFSGNNANTGEYIRVMTDSAANPYGYVDTYIAGQSQSAPTLAYIVNPVSVTVRYVDNATQASLRDSFTALGEDVTGYTINENPVIDGDYQAAFAKYYRLNRAATFDVPMVPGYTSPTSGTFTLGSVNPTLTLAYNKIATLPGPGKINTSTTNGSLYTQASSPTISLIVAEGEQQDVTYSPSSSDNGETSDQSTDQGNTTAPVEQSDTSSPWAIIWWVIGTLAVIILAAVGVTAVRRKIIA